MVEEALSAQQREHEAATVKLIAELNEAAAKAKAEALAAAAAVAAADKTIRSNRNAIALRTPGFACGEGEK
eukprot:1406819-Pyramimonas_sp.AAC.1